MSFLDLDVRRVESRHVSARQVFTKQSLDAMSIKPEVALREETDRLVLEVVKLVAVSHPHEVYWMVAQPASWWQHFKKDVLLPLNRNASTRLGIWLLEHSFPVLERQEFKEEVWTRVCPHLNMENRRHVEWLTYDPERDKIVP